LVLVKLVLLKFVLVAAREPHYQILKNNTRYELRGITKDQNFTSNALYLQDGVMNVFKGLGNSTITCSSKSSILNVWDLSQLPEIHFGEGFGIKFENVILDFEGNTGYCGPLYAPPSRFVKIKDSLVKLESKSTITASKFSNLSLESITFKQINLEQISPVVIAGENARVSLNVKFTNIFMGNEGSFLAYGDDSDVEIINSTFANISNVDGVNSKALISRQDTPYKNVLAKRLRICDSKFLWNRKGELISIRAELVEVTNSVFLNNTGHSSSSHVLTIKQNNLQTAQVLVMDSQFIGNGQVFYVGSGDFEDRFSSVMTVSGCHFERNEGDILFHHSYISSSSPPISLLRIENSRFIRTANTAVYLVIEASFCSTYVYNTEISRSWGGIVIQGYTEEIPELPSRKHELYVSKSRFIDITQSPSIFFIGKVLNNAALISDSYFHKSAAASEAYNSDIFVLKEESSFSPLMILNVQGSVFNGSRGYNGGAIHQTYGTANIKDSTFVNCFSRGSGGAIHFGDKDSKALRSLFISNSWFEGNECKRCPGGAIYASFSTFTITRSTFRKNYATAGASLFLYGKKGFEEEMTVIDSDFELNHVTESMCQLGDICGKGGAIYSNGEKTLKIESSRFVRNKADKSGGDIFARTKLIIAHSTIKDSVSYASAGSLSVTEPLSLQYCNMSNVYALFGSVLQSEGSKVEINHTNILSVTGDGPAFSLAVGSTFSMYSSKVSNMSFATSGVFHCPGNCRLSVHNSIISHVSTTAVGSLMALYGSSVNISNTTIENIKTDTFGGIFALSRHTTVDMDDCVIKDISASIGGVAFMQENSKLSMSNMDISDVHVTYGGLIFGRSESRVVITDSKIRAVEVSGAGGLIYIGERTTALIEGTTFEYSKANLGVIAYVKNGATLYLRRCTIQNLFNTMGSLINLHTKATAVIEDTYFQEIRVPHGIILYWEPPVGDELTPTSNFTTMLPGNKETTLRISNSNVLTFERNAGPTLRMSGSSVLRFEGDAFINGYSLDHSISTTAVKISGCNFSQILYNMILLDGVGSELYIENSNFYQSKDTKKSGSLIRIVGMKELLVFNSTFSGNSHDDNGGAFSILRSCHEGVSCRLVNLTFVDSIATKGGGAIYMLATTIHEMKNCKFLRNKVIFSKFSDILGGGAIYSVNSDIEKIDSCEFIENYSGRHGGAILVSGTEKNMNITNSAFIDNKCIHAGGAIYVDADTMNHRMHISSIFQNNEALQGNNTATPPVAVKWYALPPNRTIDTPTGISATEELRLKLYDAYGEVAKGHSNLVSLKVINESSQNASFSDSTVCQSTNGECCFGKSATGGCDPLIMNAIPGSYHRVKAQAYVTYEVEKVKDIFTSSYVNIHVLDCPPGTGKHTSKCLPCSPGMYNTGNSTHCLPCEPGTFAPKKMMSQCKSCRGSGGVSSEYASKKCKICGKLQIPNANATECLYCPKFSSKDSDTTCRCNEDHFAYHDERGFGKEGLKKCWECPKGGECHLPGMNDTEVVPKEGYWLDKSSDELRFIRCRNEACIGHRDKCAEGYTGKVCTECEEGYGRIEIYECRECLGPAPDITFVVLAFLLSTFIGGVLSLLSIRVSEEKVYHELESHSYRDDDERTHDMLQGRSGVLFRIMLNVYQFNAILANFDYIWEDSTLHEIFRIQSYFGMPLLVILESDCSLQLVDSTIRPFYLNCLLVALQPLILFPLTGCLVAWLYPRMGRCGSVLDGLCRCLRNWCCCCLRYEGESRDMTMISNSEYHSGQQNRSYQFTYDEKDINSSSRTNSAPKDFIHTGPKSSLIPLINDSSHELKDHKEETKEALLSAKNAASWFWRAVTGWVSYTYELYPTLVFYSLYLFKCDQIGDESLLVVDMSQKCHVGTQLGFMLGLGLPMLILYAFGFPFAILLSLISHKSYIYGAEEVQISEQGKAMMRSMMPLGLFFGGYHPQYFFWEIFVLFRKFFIVLIAVFNSNFDLQVSFSVLLLVTSIAMHLTLKPFNTAVCNVAEACGLLLGFVNVSAMGFASFANDTRVGMAIIISIVIFANIAFYFLMIVLILQHLHYENKHRKLYQTVFTAMQSAVRRCGKVCSACSFEEANELS